MRPDTIFKILFATVILVSLQSCFSNCTEISLSQDNKAWLKPYLQTKYVVFKGDQNTVDTFFLNEMYTDYTTCSKFELGPNIYNYAGISFKSKTKTPKGSKKEFYIGLEKDVNHKSQSECLIRLSVFDLTTRFDNLKDTKLIFQQVTNPYTGQTHQTFKFNRGDAFSSSPSYIRSFHWSKTDGLINFETNSGETFYFLSKKTFI